MARPLLAESGGKQVDGCPASTVPTVINCMSLPILMNRSETRWGDFPLCFSEL